jgi:hypothetical protein
MLKHCAANRERRLSTLPNVGPHIYGVKISGFTRSSIYIYDISRLRVNQETCISMLIGTKVINIMSIYIYIYTHVYVCMYRVGLKLIVKWIFS